MYLKNRAELFNLIGEVKSNKGGWTTTEFKHPEKGTNNEALYMDVFCWEPDSKPDKIIVVIGGTHGIEGHAGSIVQKHIIKDRIVDSFPPDTGIILIHALNPWGYYYGRRVDHENVDVNRGAGDTFETRGNYKKFAKFFEPDKCTLYFIRELRELIMTTYKERSVNTLNSTASGQYDWPKGLFYGGKKLCWSANILKLICQTLLSRASRIAVLDIHTGIGEYAKGSIVLPTTSTNDTLAVREQKWLGRKIQLSNNNPDKIITYLLNGDILSAMIRWLPNTEITPVFFEMGTKTTPPELLSRMIWENWVHYHPGVLPKDEEQKIKKEFLETCWLPEDKHWQEILQSQCLKTIELMVAGLNS